MFRAYENPYKLEKQLQEKLDRLQELRASGEIDEDTEISYALDIEELKDRINFAWQDDEYDENCRREAIRLGEEVAS